MAHGGRRESKAELQQFHVGEQQRLAFRYIRFFLLIFLPVTLTHTIHNYSASSNKVHVVWLRHTTNSSETLSVDVHHSVVRANPLRKYFNLTPTNPTPYNRVACYSVLLRVSYCPHRLPAHLHEDAAGAFPASGDHEHGHQKRDFVATSAGQRPHVQPLTARGLCSCFYADYGS